MPKDTAKAGKVTLLAGHPGKKPKQVGSKTSSSAPRGTPTWKLGKGTWKTRCSTPTPA